MWLVQCTNNLQRIKKKMYLKKLPFLCLFYFASKTIQGNAFKYNFLRMLPILIAVKLPACDLSFLALLTVAHNLALLLQSCKSPRTDLFHK